MNQNNHSNRLILTERDLSVLYFIFQMRFATSQQIMRACFSETRQGVARTSDLYIKRRLAKLVEAKFLSTGRPPVGGAQKYYYQVTRLSISVLEAKGYQTLVNQVPKFRTQDFDHDSHVTDCRINLEKSARAKDWVPEFQIKAHHNAFAKLPAKYIPDGLFINKLGELTAFEMEIARKAKTRYEDKVQKYVDLIRTQFDEPIKFKKVLFIAKNKDVFTLLTDLTKIYSEYFRVESFDSILEAK